MICFKYSSQQIFESSDLCHSSDFYSPANKFELCLELSKLKNIKKTTPNYVICRMTNNNSSIQLYASITDPQPPWFPVIVAMGQINTFCSTA